MIEELTLQAAQRGIKAVVGRGDRAKELIERLVENGVKAMIRFPGQINTEREIWRLLQEHGVTAVTINDFWLEGGPFPCVCADEEWGMTEMLEHLIALGHRRILLVEEMPGTPRFHAVRAFRQTLERHGLPCDDGNFITYQQCKRPKELLARPLVRPLLERGTAAVVIYDLYAMEFVEEMRRQGVAVGKDFSLASFEGTREAESHGLSAVVQPVERLVETAFDLLEDPGRTPIPKLLLKPACVFRSSTGPAPS